MDIYSISMNQKYFIIIKFLKRLSEAIPYFDIQHSTFDIRYSVEIPAEQNEPIQVGYGVN